jgi:hypothetical protein
MKLNVDNLDFVVENLDVEMAVLDESDHLGKHLVAETLVVADTAKPYRGELPGVVIADLRHRHLELVADLPGDRFQNLPLSLEVHIFRNAQENFAHSNIHSITTRLISLLI